MRGTALLFGRSCSPPLQESAWKYFVTARHVIEGIKAVGSDQVFIRINSKAQGIIWYESRVSNWLFHPVDTVDVAVLRLSADFDEIDHEHLFVEVAKVATAEIIDRNEIGPGDEVFIIGLFVRHAGQGKNLPIVRIGHIAAMPEELVATGLGRAEAYLVEALSIGGLSGSPVFVNCGMIRSTRNGVGFPRNGRPALYFLGLIHGHYDEPSGVERPALLNTGIGVVTPATRVLEAIEQPDVRNHELQQERRMIESKSIDKAQ